MPDWKDLFVKLVEEGKSDEATSVLLEYNVEEQDIVQAIHDISCWAIDYIHDHQLVQRLDNIVRKLEGAL